MQALLISLLQILASILEASFSRKSSSLPEDHAGDDDFFHNGTAGNGTSEAGPSAKGDVKLQKAYQVLELTPPVESIDEVRKQWKKLSRRHHPDRNNGSEESHAKQQEINHAMDYIESVFEGNNNDAEEEEEVSEEENEAPPPPDRRDSHQTPPNPQPNKRQSKEERQREKRRRKKQRREERWRQQEEHRKRREAMKAQMEEEMRKEQELHDKIVKERRKIERETSRLGDLEQRQASSRLFMDQVQRYRRQEPVSYEKPKHYIMESCTNELVIAMRLGMDDYASRILDDEVNLLLKNLVMRPSEYSHILLPVMKENRGYLTIERLTEVAIGHVLLMKLDEDDNTLLHHAVYWEREQMIRSIFRMAQYSGLLEEVSCAKDAHGAIPMDLAWVAKNLEIRAVLKQYESIVRLQQESKRLDLASVRVAKQFWKKVTGEFDIISLLNSCLAYYLSCYCAGFHWVWAWVGVAALQSPDIFHWILVGSETPTANNDVRLDSFLFYLAFSKATWGVFWACMYLVTTTPAVAFELCLLLVPIFILLGWSHVTPERILEFMNLPLFIWSWTSATFLYKPSVLLEKHLFLKLWSYFPPQIRKRYSLLHTFMLLTVWLVINIAILASRSRHVVSGNKDDSTGGDEIL